MPIDKMYVENDVLHIESSFTYLDGTTQFDDYMLTKSEVLESLQNNINGYIDEKQALEASLCKWRKTLYSGIGDEPEAERAVDRYMSGFEMFEDGIREDIKRLKLFELTESEKAIINNAENMLDED